MEKLHLRADDSLVLLGDLVEKGPESLATLRYAMALREKCRVYPVLGNCVSGISGWTGATWNGTCGRSPISCAEGDGARGLILEMCAELGETLSADTDLAALKPLLREAFAPEFEYLRPCRSRSRATNTSSSTAAFPTAKRWRVRAVALHEDQQLLRRPPAL